MVGFSLVRTAPLVFALSALLTLGCGGSESEPEIRGPGGEGGSGGTGGTGGSGGAGGGIASPAVEIEIPGSELYNQVGYELFCPVDALDPLKAGVFEARGGGDTIGVIADLPSGECHVDLSARSADGQVLCFGGASFALGATTFARVSATLECFAAVVDTGPATTGDRHSLFASGRTGCSPQPECAERRNFLAGRFELTETVTILEVQGWMDGGTQGEITVHIRTTDDHKLPGGSIHSKTYVAQGGRHAERWVRFSDYDVTLGAGTYWVSFEPVHGSNYSAAMRGGVPNPLSNYAFAFYRGESPVQGWTRLGPDPSDELGMRLLAPPGTHLPDSGWTPVEDVGYFKGRDTDLYDYFGNSVSLSADGNTLAIGAGGTHYRVNGVVEQWRAGAVYVFTRSEGAWRLQGYLDASEPGEHNSFGGSVSLSADGNTLAIGAVGRALHPGESEPELRAGAVYVFTRTGDQWTERTILRASNAEADDRFGRVSLSADGTTLAVAANEGSRAIGVDGDQSDNLAPSSGAVYVFAQSGSAWSQQAYIKASNTDAGDRFGSSLSLSSDGNTLAVGALNEASSASGIDGDQSNNSASEAGAAYVFSRDGSTWSQQEYIKASNMDRGDYFGYDVSLSADGNTLAVGGRREESRATGTNGNQGDDSLGLAGAAYLFTRNGSDWSQETYLKASNTGFADYFGESVSLSADGNYLVVTASGEDSKAIGVNGDQADNSVPFSGAAYLFARIGGSWGQEAYIKASNPDEQDFFGHSVSLSGDGSTLVVGTPQEDSNATGINGDHTDNSAEESGAAYVYDVTSLWPQAQVRVAHLAPEIPSSEDTAIDVFIDGELSEIQDLTFGNAAGLVELPPGEHVFGVAPANGAPLFSFTALLSVGQPATLVAIRTLNNRGVEDPVGFLFFDGTLEGLAEGNGRYLAGHGADDTAIPFVDAINPNTCEAAFADLGFGAVQGPVDAPANVLPGAAAASGSCDLLRPPWTAPIYPGIVSITVIVDHDTVNGSLDVVAYQLIGEASGAIPILPDLPTGGTGGTGGAGVCDVGLCFGDQELRAPCEAALDACLDNVGGLGREAECFVGAPVICQSIDGLARMVTIGSVTIENEHLLDDMGLGDNLQFLMNALAWLCEGRGQEGSYQILHSSSCDPRTDPDICLRVSDVALLDPFYDAVSALGELTYSNAADVASLDAYSAVILDFCAFPSPSQADLDAIMAFLRAGGRVMVAAQTFCTASIWRATEFLAPFNVEHTYIDPQVWDYINIPIEEQVGFLESVAEFQRFRWTPQILGVGSGFFPIVESNDGVLSAYGVLDPSSIP